MTGLLVPDEYFSKADLLGLSGTTSQRSTENSQKRREYSVISKSGYLTYPAVLWAKMPL